MITQGAYGVEPWSLKEAGLNMDLLAQSESVFALSNGHIGLRGNLDEGEPHGLPGTYLNSFFEQRPLPYAEAGYGYPESGQTVINVTNGKLIRLLVDDEPFDIRYGTLNSHDRVLDLRAGTLTRHVDWTPPAGSRVRVTSTRMVSLTQRAIAGISYTVEPVDGQVRLVAQSELVANEQLPDGGRDPRAAAALESPLISEEFVADNDGQCRAILVHSTRVSGLRMAAGMLHEVQGPERMSIHSEAYPDVGRALIAAEVPLGEKLHITKYIGYGWSSTRSRPAVHDQVAAALALARLTGWDQLLAEQRAFLDDFWAGADVEGVGDPEIQQAGRFALFRVLQSGARAETRPIAAKGLTGPGYDGHTFWDTETFVLPVLNFTQPQAAADALRWRHSVLPLARARRHGRVPHQRRHRPVGAGLRGRHRRRAVRARDRGRDPDRDRAAVAEPRPPRRRGPVPHRRGHRPRRVQRDQRQQHLHQPDGPAEPGRRGRPGREVRRRGREPRGDHRGGGRLAGRGQGDDDPVRPAAGCAPAARRVHRARGVGLRPHPGGELSAAAALPVLRPVPQAGGQAGRPGAGHPAVRGRLHRRAEGPRLRLLRTAHRPGLVPVGLHPGRGRGRGRPARAGPRVSGRSGPDGPAGPGAQHPRRHAHGLAGRSLGRPGPGVRRHAPDAGRPGLRAPAAQRLLPAQVPHALPGPPAPADRDPPRSHLRADRRRGTDHPPLRRSGHPGREGDPAEDPGHPGRPPPPPAQNPRAHHPPRLTPDPTGRPRPGPAGRARPAGGG